MRVFVNTILAQGWREAAIEVDEHDLAARAEPFAHAGTAEDRKPRLARVGGA
jgi:hypothetical protein